MEDQLIAFKTAKLAKQKGFKEPCKQWYGGDGSEQEVIAKSKYHCNNSTDIESSEKFGYSRPTQTKLNRWLREKKGKEIVISPLGNSVGKTIGYFYEIIVEDFNEPNITDDETYTTFEETLEIALLEALKEL